MTPRSQERKFEKQYAKELLKIALLAELNDYAAVRRYEEGRMLISKSDLAAVLDKASQILKWATGVLAINR